EIIFRLVALDLRIYLARAYVSRQLCNMPPTGLVETDCCSEELHHGHQLVIGMLGTHLARPVAEGEQSAVDMPNLAVTLVEKCVVATDTDQVMAQSIECRPAVPEYEKREIFRQDWPLVG